MKKYWKVLALVLMLALAGAQAVPAFAMLTEEEQLAYKRKKADEAEKDSKQEQQDSEQEQTETETAKETEKETGAAEEAETSTEDEKESEEAQTNNGEDEEAPLVAIDPGHQAPGQDMSGVEPNGPGSEVMKARLATGTSGCVSGLDEYELDLEVSLKLRDELLARGYRVIMTRETHDINISNIERCQLANEAGADILLRIHANGSEDSSVSGALTAAPSQNNPYVSGIYNSCMKLADDMINAYCETTGFKNQGIWITDDMTGINWSKMPVTILEMGYMTNPEDDAYMADPANQEIMVQGIANGVDVYFGRN